MRSWPAPAAERAWSAGPAMSCATPASPDSGRRAWHSRRSRPRPGHRSIESTRVYLHLTNDWLAGEYRRAAGRIDQAAVAELVAAQEIAR